jgi:hypothetical protein
VAKTIPLVRRRLIEANSSEPEIAPDALNDRLEIDCEAKCSRLQLNGFIERPNQSFSFPGGAGWNLVATISIEPNINIGGRYRGVAVNRADLSSIGSPFPVLGVPARVDSASTKIGPGIAGPKFRRHRMKTGIDIFAERYRLIVISDESICDRPETVLTKRGVDCLTGLLRLAFASLRNVVDCVVER